MAKMTFCGGSGTVTGSSYLIETSRVRFLVDCGLFQGNKSVRALNAKDFPYSPGDVDFLLLTHAHIDHSGLIPKLSKHGFRGPIHATAPTLDLLEFMLVDSGAIQENEVRYKNRRNKKRGRPLIEPIYTKRDAERCLDAIEPHELEQWFEPGPGVRARFWNAGHIIGSVSIELEIEEGEGRAIRMLFSGDLGPEEKVFHHPPEGPSGWDYVICESTYGDRERADYTLDSRRAALKREMLAAHEAGGNLIIPAFAVERSQELLHDIGVLMAKGEVAERPIYLDSPLAAKATRVFMEHTEDLPDVERDVEQLFSSRRFRIVESVEESMELNRVSSGVVILSASGMCDAGRIKHHLKHNIWRREATVLLVGYMAPGSLGAHIKAGEPEVRIHGRDIAVRARIRELGNYSAHADQSELIEWIEKRRPIARALILTHGDDDARAELARQLRSRGKLEAPKILEPQLDDTLELFAADPAPEPSGRPARIEPDAMVEDWSAAHARFHIALAQAIDRAKDDAERAAIVERVRDALAR